jgi:hypothetical protein
VKELNARRQEMRITARDVGTVGMLVKVRLGKEGRRGAQTHDC